MRAQWKTMTVEEFKSAVSKGDPVQDVLLRKQFVLEEVKEVEGEDRVLQFTISTGNPDRESDTISVDGWKLDNYRKNPVVLWAHDYSEPPVAKSLAEWVEEGKLKSRAQFTPRELYPFGYMIYEMYKHGYMNAVSVGFLPLKWVHNEERDGFFPIDFVEQELLEYSAVPVPANPEALIDARSKGIDLAPLVEWAEKVLDGHYGEGLWVPRKTAEQVYQILAKKSPVVTVSLDSLNPLAVPGEAARVKGVSPDDVSMETAPEDTPWEAPDLEDFTDRSWDELSDAEKRRIAGHFAWAAAMPPERYGDLKLPHHRPSDGAVVWRGVANAAARLPQTDVPDEDIPKIQRHLGRHYEQFGRTPPWEEQEELWNAYVHACKQNKDALVEVLRRELFPELYARAEPEYVLELVDDEPEVELDVEPDQLKQSVKEILQGELAALRTAVLGKAD